jgi:hypothetical protein
MSDAAKQWNAAIEDPSKLVAENNRLRDDLGERDECIARLEMRYENDALRWEETEKDLRASCVRASRELEASVEYHANFRDKIDKALGQPRGDGDILSAILFEIEKIKGDAEHASSELANALIREQKLWAENQKLKEDISDYEIEMRSRSDAAEKLARELNTERMQRKEYESLAKSLEKELAAAPHWVPVAEFKNDSKFHTVWDHDEDDVFEAKLHKGSGAWFASYDTGRRLNVTHVLVGLNPPVAEQCIDPRGDGDMPSTSERLDNLACERMCDRPALKYGTEEGDKCNRNGCDGTIALDRAANCYCHIIAPCSQCTDKNRLHCDKCLIRGSDLDSITPDTDVKLSVEQMAVAFDKMIDVTKLADEDAIRERLLRPFYGSEAEKLGATKYQLRDGETWFFELERRWLKTDEPMWIDADQYRLATGE